MLLALTNLLSLFLCSSSFSSFSPHLPSTSSCLLTSSHLVHAACGIVANHLSPQVLKWREYRQRNPLGLDCTSGLPGLASSVDRRQQEPRLNQGNPIFEFPGTLNTNNFHCKLNGMHRPSAGGSGGDLGAQIQCLSYAWPHHCSAGSEQESRCICSQWG